MDPVRLALDVGPLHGHRTGVGVAVAAIADALATREDVELVPYVLSFRGRPEPPTRRLPLPAAVAHRLWSRVDAPRLDRWLGTAQVVHGTNYVVPPTRHPAVVSVYDCWFLMHPELAAPAVARAGAVLRRRVRAGATVHASSRTTADRVRELLGTDRIEVVHLGPPAPHPPSAAGPPARPATWTTELAGHRFVLALGTLERRKGIAGLVAAFGAVVAARPDARLVLAGAPGDDTAAVDAAIDALAPAARTTVVRAGIVDAATKGWLLAHATALAYPSLDEGFGFPVLEAQQAGLPVVATDAGSIPEIAGAGATLVPVGDVDALAAALGRVLDDDGARAALVAAGCANLDRFSWAATAAALVDLYCRLREGS